MLQIRNLRKSFGDLQVLKSIDLDVNKGDETAALRTAIDAAIDELRADGTLKALSEKYFGRDISTEE